MKKVLISLFITAVILLGTILSGCGSIPPSEPLAADNTTAKVYFIMPNSGTTFSGGSLMVGTNFFLWDSDTYLSTIGGKEYIMLNMKAGTHYIMASGGNWYTVQAEFSAGKSYYFEVITLPGFSYPNVRLRYIEPGNPDLDNYINDCKEISPKGKITQSMITEAGEKLESAKKDENIDRVPPIN